MVDVRHQAGLAARNAGVDPALFNALVQRESGFDPSAVSGAGAFGLTQAMPATAAQPGYGVAPMEGGADATTQEQLRFGADYLGAMQARFPGDLRRALAAYNWGPGNAGKWSGNLDDLPQETRAYVTGLADVPEAGIRDDKAARTYANIIESSPDAPAGDTGRRIVDRGDVGDDLVSAGLEAMNTGDLSGLSGMDVMDDREFDPEVDKFGIREKMRGLGRGIRSSIGGVF